MKGSKEMFLEDMERAYLIDKGIIEAEREMEEFILKEGVFKKKSNFVRKAKLYAGKFTKRTVQLGYKSDRTDSKSSSDNSAGLPF